MELNRIECVSAENKCHNMECSISRFKNRTKIVHLNCDIYEPIYSVLIKYTVYYKFRTLYRKFLIDGTENICNYLKNNSKVVSPLFDSLVQYAPKRLVHPCPFNGSIYVDMDISTIKIKNLPMPTGQYRVDLELFNGNPKNEKNAIIIYQTYITVPAGKSVDEFTLSG